MSFSSEIKDKLALIENDCALCDREELAAIFKTAGKTNGEKITISTENRSVIECAARLIYRNTGTPQEYIHRVGSGIYEIVTDNEYLFENLADSLGLFDAETDGADLFECCRAAYIRGAFLAGGSITDPNKSYHLEFACRYEKYAAALEQRLAQLGIAAKITRRKGYHVVYVKEYETIADILGLMGAGGAAMEIYNVSIEKDLKNSINRQMNCETANMDKITEAYIRHLQAITLIKKTVGIEALPDNLREIAYARLEYPEYSLKQLGETLTSPIGKSGVNHRLNRIIEFAEGLKNERKETE